MSKKNGKAIISVGFVIFALVAAFLINYFDSDSQENISGISAKNGEVMTVEFVDVGQGDCEFIELPDGKCMLIDSGEKYYADMVEEKIKNEGYTTIDYLIVTHPHTDHMGGMSQIISDFDIGEIYMPYATSNTKTFENMLEAIDSKDMTINTAKAGVTISFSDEITGEFLAPVGSNYDDLNNYSAVLKLTYNDVSFLFTGDAEDISENEMLENSYSELDADVLKVGHHGSRYSTSNEFLYAVSPQYAVIECGEDNKYGHPHNETVTRLEEKGVDIYRTDLNGNITFVTDGMGIDLATQY
ncbi:MAG: ComEC/Rec2 family competence protein [Eubacterium sp.]